MDESIIIEIPIEKLSVNLRVDKQDPLLPIIQHIEKTKNKDLL